MMIRTTSLALFVASAMEPLSPTNAASATATSFAVDGHSSKYLVARQSEEDARHNRHLSELIPDAAEDRRTLARFTKGDPENEICWDRQGVDGFLTVVDAHNHFQPFEGPNVPYDQYIGWMTDHGILFSVITGLGQRIIKTNPDDPDCCYYLHCPTFNYTVTPAITSDVLNAEWFTTGYPAKFAEDIFLILSATFPDLQVPENNLATLDELEARFPNAFAWAGEINLVKHALAANGFFNNPTVTEADITTEGSALNDFFRRIAANGWPLNIHADLGCDNFDSVPGWEDRCIVEDMALAQQNAEWYKGILGIHYESFFEDDGDETVEATPKPNFRKIQYLKLFDTILSTFPDLKVVWAHTGLSKELLNLHPAVHSDIMEALFERHPNLYTDMSWDILPQLYLMNYDPETDSIDNFRDTPHEDISSEALAIFDWEAVETLRLALTERWDRHDETVEMFGSGDKVTGPTHAMSIYYRTIHDYPDRYLTGTDFVASLFLECTKDKANHARQLTDTSSVNIMLDDDAFQKIVLGENFFRITGLGERFQAPPVCGVESATTPCPSRAGQ